MAITVVNGGQWGDEGKGKVIDFLARYYDIGIRGTAGDNAGHTVNYGEQPLKFRLIPSTIAFGKKSIIGDDVMINPKTLIEEIQTLEHAGIDVKNKLSVSRNAHIILPYHKVFDCCVEDTDNMIGTTKRGVGPAIADKADRIGIRMEEFVCQPIFYKHLAKNLQLKNSILKALYPDAPHFDLEELFKEFSEIATKLEPFICDTVEMVHELIKEGKNILIEGAQGSMNDLVYGTYPYVTSSRPVASGVVTGTGIGPTAVDNVISVIKPYQTRVGIGPVFGEIFNKIAGQIIKRGKEYGTVTGRPRRVMWFDSVVVNYTRKINNTKSFALTKFDVLDRLKEIKICVSYEREGQEIMTFPSQVGIEDYKENYISLTGWQEDTSQIRDFDHLPKNARKFVKTIEELTETPISLISVGPKREQTIVVREDYLI